jgi:cbb3-type cytochrome oxidase subunit 3
MKLSDVVSHSGLSGYAVVALVLFVVAFVAVVLWALRPGAAARMRDDARLPLDDNGGDA